jgi:VacB/RNase II family 3'-5' exoribonuclease
MFQYSNNHRQILSAIAHKAMLDRGLIPDFSREVKLELDNIQTSINPKKSEASLNLRDMRSMLWCSIDDDDSLDLDQLTVAELLPDKLVKIYVSIADVDAKVKKDGAIDEHAHHNTTTVYTVGMIFSMLPEILSTNLTSLNFNEDRTSVIVEMIINEDGSLKDSAVYMALVNNKAKLAYNSVAAWLEGKTAIPEKVAEVNGLAENLIMQDAVAQKMKGFRHRHGALSLETIESKPVFNGDQIQAMEFETKNRAREVVENFMIVANGVTARFLSDNGYPSIRRVVSIPDRWDRIVEIAARYHYQLPAAPDAKILEDFLVQQRTADPLRFPDLSLSVIKLLGAGEYSANPPDGNLPGHFSLAVKDYGHSTAPNRRFTDLVTQRLLKSAITKSPQPYTFEELQAIALHCTQAEDAANKVERQVEKSADAMLLESRIGEKFDAIITGAADKGTWVRLTALPVEGKLMKTLNHPDVGDRIKVELINVDVEKGYIDFNEINQAIS